MIVYKTAVKANSENLSHFFFFAENQVLHSADDEVKYVRSDPESYIRDAKDFEMQQFSMCLNC